MVGRELALSTAATLLLEDNPNPVAVIFVGPPSSGKTTVAEMFADAKVGADNLSYVSDNFTPAAFVSHAANVSSKNLTKVDLLPRIRHKVLVTPELATIFRGKEDDLTRTFAVLIRVLDGRGLQTDSGTHGQRGYRGDYTFAWLGCTTPFEPKVWRVMAQLGSRLFFFELESPMATLITTRVRTMAARAKQTVPYTLRLKDCTQVVHQLLDHLFTSHGGVRGVTWDSSNDPPRVRKRIAELATVLVTMRSEPSPDHLASTSAQTEAPDRAFQVLYSIARGHALVYGRQRLIDSDLALLVSLTLSSMPIRRRRVFVALLRNHGNPLTAAQVQSALGARHPGPARDAMDELDRLGIMEFEEQGVGKAAHIAFRPEWAWCARPTFRGLVLRRVR